MRFLPCCIGVPVGGAPAAVAVPGGTAVAAEAEPAAGVAPLVGHQACAAARGRARPPSRAAAADAMVAEQ